MNIIKISKGNGKYRTIYVPNDEERNASAALVHPMARLAARLDTHGVQHGFTEGRNCVTNALQHIGYQYTLSFDLKDFFDSVTAEHLDRAHGVFPLSIVGAGFFDGAARQGLPSSPSIANVAAVPMDNDIWALGKGNRMGRIFAYTRYADDLTFSFDNPATAQFLMLEIPKIVERHGFRINPDKTHLQCAKSGRRIVTGVAVGETKVYPTREVKRRLRAAAHQMRTGLRGRNLRRLIAIQRLRARTQKSKPSLNSLLVGGAKGLAEWAKLRLPAAVTKVEPQVQAQVQVHQADLPDTASTVAIIHPMLQRGRRIASC